MKNLRVGAFVAFLAALAPLPFGPGGDAVAGEVVDRIVAVVDKDLILLSDLDGAVEAAAKQRLRGLSGAEKEAALGDLRTEALDFLINDKLIEQAMDKADIVVEDREVEAAIGDVAKQNRLSVEQLEAELKRQGMPMMEYRQQTKQQLRRYRFMNMHIRGRVNISDEDVQSYYRQMMSETGVEPAWRLLRLFLAFPKDDAAAKTAVEAEAGGLMTQLASGGDFGALAKARSDDDSTADRGGDAGVVKAADLSPLWADTLGAAAVGETVRLDAENGIWLLQVAEEVNAAVRPIEEVKGQIMQLLYERGMEAEMGTWAEEQRERTHLRILL